MTDPSDQVFLQNSNLWPSWPVCPLTKGEQTGLVVDGMTDSPVVVYLINLWALKTGPLGPQLEGVEKVKYDSIEALLADGWKVD